MIEETTGRAKEIRSIVVFFDKRRSNEHFEDREAHPSSHL